MHTKLNHVEMSISTSSCSQDFALVFLLSAQHCIFFFFIHKSQCVCIYSFHDPMFVKNLNVRESTEIQKKRESNKQKKNQKEHTECKWAISWEYITWLLLQWKKFFTCIHLEMPFEENLKKNSRLFVVLKYAS